jgi:hypothetical protein
MLLLAYLRKVECYYVINGVPEEGCMFIMLLFSYPRMVVCYYVINCVPEDGSMLLWY